MATQVLIGDLKIALDSEYQTYSMDDSEYFGIEFHKLSFGEAIKRKLLVDYEIIVFSFEFRSKKINPK